VFSIVASIDSRLRRAVVDRYNGIEAGTEMGFNRDEGIKHYVVTANMIVIVPKGEADCFGREPCGVLGVTVDGVSNGDSSIPIELHAIICQYKFRRKEHYIVSLPWAVTGF